MLLSHRHGFLFVHIAKTGGTSIQAALRQGWWRDPLAWAAWCSHRFSGLAGHRCGTRIPRHAPALVCREMLPPDVYHRLFVFAFVRNPWDRLVSAYAHFLRERTDVLEQHQLSTFPAFVRFILHADPAVVRRGALVRAIQRPQLESVVDLQGQLIVDYLGRFESLDRDFDEVRQRLGVTTKRLPHARRSERSNDYRVHFDDELAQEVAVHYAADLAAFQYAFDGDRDGVESPSASAPQTRTLAIAGRIVAEASVWPTVTAGNGLQ